MQITMTISSTGCDGGDCPTVYVTDERTVLVQGPNFDATRPEGVGLGAGESVVEIPEELLRRAVARLDGTNSAL